MPRVIGILAIIVIAIWSQKRYPDLAKGIGKGIKDFKKAVKDDEDEVAPSKRAKRYSKEDMVANTQSKKKI